MSRYDIYKEVDLIWLDEIPKHWSLIKVKNIFEISKDLSYKENPTVLSLTRDRIKIRNISNNEGQLAESYNNYNSVEVGDLLLNPMDLYSGANCNISQYSGVISPAYINLRSKQKICVKYFDYIFKKQYTSFAFQAVGKGVSLNNRWTLSNFTLLNYLIPIPPLSEQENIANYLDWKIGEIDKLIEIEKKKLDELEELISNKIDRYILKIKNNSSQHIKLRYLYSFQNGISTSKDYKTGKYPFLTYSDVYNNLVIPRKLSGKIDSTPEERKVYSIKKGDLFFTRTSERLEDAGKVSLADKSVSYSVFNGFTIRLRPNNRTVFLDKFILYYLNSNLVRESFIGTLNIVTRVSIKQELLKNIEIPFIPKDEQRKLINHIELMFKNSTKIIELSKNKISYLFELKQSLISEVVTGQIDVRNVKIPERK